MQNGVLFCRNGVLFLQDENTKNTLGNTIIYKQSIVDKNIERQIAICRFDTNLVACNNMSSL